MREGEGKGDAHFAMPSGRRPVRSKKNGSNAPITGSAKSAASALRVRAVEDQHRETFAPGEVVAHERAETEPAFPVRRDLRPVADRDEFEEGARELDDRFSVPQGCRLRAPTWKPSRS